MRKLGRTERLIDHEGTIENGKIKDVKAFTECLLDTLSPSDFAQAFAEEGELCFDVSFDGSFCPGDFDTRIDPGYPDSIEDFECVFYEKIESSTVRHILTSHLTDKYIEQIKGEMITAFIDKMTEEKEYAAERMAEERAERRWDGDL